jgi:histone-lysine N-methyltransferase ASH1L
VFTTKKFGLLSSHLLQTTFLAACPFASLDFLHYQQLHATYLTERETMFSALLDRMGASPRVSSRLDTTRALSSDSIHSVITVDTSNAQSSSSTPPTSIGDSVSVSSGPMEIENTLATPAEESSGRSSRRQRTSVNTYNVKVLSGTARHAPKKYCKNQNNGEVESETRRRTISGNTLVGTLASRNSSSATIQMDAERLVSAGINALDLQWSVKKLPRSRRSQIGLGGSPKKTIKQEDSLQRKATRSAGAKSESLTKSLSTLGKRGRDNFEGGLKKVKRELRNLADTNEYAKIDIKPVVHEVWSNGKLVIQEPPKKKRKVEEVATKKPQPEEAKPAEKKHASRKQKVWMDKGLYAGQEAKNFDWFSSYTEEEKAKMVDVTPFKPNDFMPLPMWHGQRLLHVGRHFKLPYDVCSPLPPGQPKPDEWRKTSSSRLSFLKHLHSC